MNEALCSILCGEKEWRYCDRVKRLIKFNKDGTGEVCHHNSCASISLFLGRLLTTSIKVMVLYRDVLLYCGRA
jgi:hypothetical protein